MSPFIKWHLFAWFGPLVTWPEFLVCTCLYLLVLQCFILSYPVVVKIFILSMTKQDCSQRPLFFPGFSVDTLITSSNVWQVSYPAFIKGFQHFFSLNGYDPRSSDYIFQLRLDISPVFICELSFHLCFYLISSFLICVPQRYLLQS